MSAETQWRPFGVPAGEYDQIPDRHGIRVLNLTMRRARRGEEEPGERAGAGLIRAATMLLLALGVALLLVSVAAQYRYVLNERHQPLTSWIEASALDLGMLIFSLLALGLARAGLAAKVERALIIACAAGSALMNYAAADVTSPRSILAYCMPPVFLAVVVDRVVVSVRRHVLGMRAGRSPWVTLGIVVLYGLRTVLALPSTAAGLRRAVLAATPLPQPVLEHHTPALPADGEPGTAAAGAGDIPEPAEPGAPQAPPAPPRSRRRGSRGQSKTARFLALVAERHGDLAGIDPAKVSRICTDLAPVAGLDVGAARSALRPRVLAARAAGGAS